VPESADSGNYEFTFTVTDYNEPSHVSSLTYTLFVRQIFDISVETISEPSNVNQGDTAEWSLRITKNGNGGDRITLVLDNLQSNWNYSFASDSTFELPQGPPGENLQNMVLTLEIPDEAPPATYEFNVSAQSLGITTNLTLSVTLNTFYQVSVTETSSTELTAQVGETVYFQFDVRNKGNSADTISVTAGGSMIDQATPVSFGWTSKTLQANEVQSNYLKATIPNGEGPWTALVTVTSSNSSASAETVTFTLNGVVLPDARVRDLLFSPSSPNEGDKVTARFTILATNSDISSLPYIVTVDGRTIKNGIVTGLEAEGSELVSVNFVASTGCEEVKVVLDPSQSIQESDTSNNQISNTICAESSGGDNLPIYIAILAVVIVAGAVAYRYSNSSKSLFASKSSVRKPVSPVVTETPVNFPLILNCTQCGSRVRVARPGSFRCPSCKSVSSVDSNGKIEAVEAGDEDDSKRVTHVTQNINITDSVISKSNLGAEEIKSSNTGRRRRMEEFLDENEKKQEPEEEPEPERELSASEKLKKLKEGEDAQKEPQETEEPVKKEKKTKKRRGPPKGGSFGPTIGGF